MSFRHKGRWFEPVRPKITLCLAAPSSGRQKLRSRLRHVFRSFPWISSRARQVS